MHRSRSNVVEGVKSSKQREEDENTAGGNILSKMARGGWRKVGGESGEQTGGSVRETMGMGRRAAGPVIWKHTCGKSVGRGGGQPTADESKDKKGQRLDSFFFFFLNKWQWATPRVSFYVTSFFFFPSPKWLKRKQQFASSPFRRSCISPCRWKSESFFEERCRRWATAF